MTGPMHTTELLDAIHHDPVAGDRAVELEASVEDVSTPQVLRSWESAHARIDPANPNRLIITQSVEAPGPNGTTASREVRFFVEVGTW